MVSNAAERLSKIGTENHLLDLVTRRSGRTLARDVPVDESLE